MALIGCFLQIHELRVCLEQYVCDACVMVRAAISSSMQEYLACRVWVIEVWWDYERFLEWQDEQAIHLWEQEMYDHYFPGVMFDDGFHIEE